MCDTVKTALKELDLQGGGGVEINQPEALKWLRAAAAKGHTDAQKYADQLALKMGMQMNKHAFSRARKYEVLALC